MMTDMKSDVCYGVNECGICAFIEKMLKVYEEKTVSSVKR